MSCYSLTGRRGDWLFEDASERTGQYWNGPHGIFNWLLLVPSEWTQYKDAQDIWFNMWTGATEIRSEFVLSRIQSWVLENVEDIVSFVPRTCCFGGWRVLVSVCFLLVQTVGLPGKHYISMERILPWGLRVQQRIWGRAVDHPVCTLRNQFCQHANLKYWNLC